MKQARSKIIIERFLYPEIEEVNSFLVACPSSKQALLVDAGGFDDRIVEFISSRSLNLTTIFVTHAHYDHSDAIVDVLKLHPDIQVLSFSPLPGTKGGSAQDNDSIKLGNLSGIIHHIPGHTDDMLVLFIEDHLFTGDALFAGSVGGTANNDRYKMQIDGIRSKLNVYPGETVIHPGHGPDSTLQIERTFNPFL